MREVEEILTSFFLSQKGVDLCPNAHLQRDVFSQIETNDSIRNFFKQLDDSFEERKNHIDPKFEDEIDFLKCELETQICDSLEICSTAIETVHVESSCIQNFERTRNHGLCKCGIDENQKDSYHTADDYEQVGFIGVRKRQTTMFCFSSQLFAAFVGPILDLEYGDVTLKNNWR